MPRPPQILATSGGLTPRPGVRAVDRGGLMNEAIRLADVQNRPAKICGLFTAVGDDAKTIAMWYDAVGAAGDVFSSHVTVFDMPNHVDYRAHLLAQDVVWVCGGSTANLLALWRLHHLDEIMRECWEAGIVLTGVSAGSLCWHLGGTTDSFGLELQAINDGLGFLPYSNCPHYDGEKQRRPLYQRLVGDGTLPAGYATDNGVGLHYVGTELVDVVREIPGEEVAAYRVERDGEGTAKETRLEARLVS
jgi:peptidase E